MQFLVNLHQTQIAAGLTPNNVKFSTSLPVLHHSTVTGIVDVYNFMTGMTGPTGCKLIKKVSLESTS